MTAGDSHHSHLASPSPRFTHAGAGPTGAPTPQKLPEATAECSLRGRKEPARGVDSRRLSSRSLPRRLRRRESRSSVSERSCVRHSAPVSRMQEPAQAGAPTGQKPQSCLPARSLHTILGIDLSRPGLGAGYVIGRSLRNSSAWLRYSSVATCGCGRLQRIPDRNLRSQVTHPILIALAVRNSSGRPRWRA